MEKAEDVLILEKPKFFWMNPPDRQLPRLIGLAGPHGSGKDTLADILVRHHAYTFVSISDLLREEVKKRGWSLERDSLLSISSEWRARFGRGVLVDRAYQQAKGARRVVIASLRNPGEARLVHELGGIVVWIDASPQIRYRRIVNRGRGAEDFKSFEAFLAEETREMRPLGGVNGSHMLAVKKQADVVLDNSGADLKAFRRLAERALAAG